MLIPCFIGYRGFVIALIVSIDHRVATTALVVTLDGTMYLVDNSPGSMKVIWSFSTGSPIYQSYRAPVERDTDKENASAALMSGFVECGDDWSLYMHDRHFGKMFDLSCRPTPENEKNRDNFCGLPITEFKEAINAFWQKYC
ncbi:hypothetical protein V8G54_003081 [Vigna mungo]|uniref:Uncharacterized protein n=1 Tax=Vigna mungo TaxID=3915 RepID=A0AAQ3PBF1_VIGMU